ncbi:MAG: hypothetical protein ACRYGR_06030 [Janthinobacterium lividum]
MLGRELEYALQAAEAFEASLDLDNVSFDVDLQTVHDARDDYHAKAEKHRSRAWMRDGKELADILNAMTAMIPDEKGLSVLKGGLAFIFRVCLFLIDRSTIITDFWAAAMVSTTK